MSLDISDLIKGKKILVIGAHPDDIELGMGGTLWKLRKETIELTVFSSAKTVNGNDAIEDEFWNSMKHYGITIRTCLWQDIHTMEFYKFEDYIKNRLYYTRQHFKPDIIFCTNPKSDNRDHAILGECVLNVFQEQSVLFYEDVRGGREHRADLYVKLDVDDIGNKNEALYQYRSQYGRKYFDFSKIKMMAGFRGIQIGHDFAETFEVARLVV